MRERGLQGVTSRRVRGCTRTRASDPRSDDLVDRQFRPDGPDRLWVQDVTQHRTTWIPAVVATVFVTKRSVKQRDVRLGCPRYVRPIRAFA